MIETYVSKIASEKKAKALRTEGYKAADLHWHTFGASHDVPNPNYSAVKDYDIAWSRGMDFITPSDHDTLDGYVTIAGRPGTYPNVEIKIHDKKRVGHTVHVNVPGINRNQFRELEDMANGRFLRKDDFERLKAGEKISDNGNMDAFLSFLRKENLPHIYNHPFWFEPGEDVSYQTVSDLAAEFPVLEWNAHGTLVHNLMTLDLASAYKKGVVATTDNHSGGVGLAYTLAKGANFDEWFDNVAKGDAFIVPQNLTVELYNSEEMSYVDALFISKNAGKLKPNAPGFLKRMQNWNPNGRPYKVAGFLIKKLVESKIPARLYVSSEKRAIKRLADTVDINTVALVDDYEDARRLYGD